jgi:hypothetical protein
MCKKGEHVEEWEGKELTGLGRAGREGRHPRRSAEAGEEGARKTGLPSIWRRGRMGRQPVPGRGRPPSLEWSAESEMWGGESPASGRPCGRRGCRV